MQMSDKSINETRMAAAGRLSFDLVSLIGQEIESDQFEVNEVQVLFWSYRKILGWGIARIRKNQRETILVVSDMSMKKNKQIRMKKGAQFMRATIKEGTINRRWGSRISKR